MQRGVLCVYYNALYVQYKRRHTVYMYGRAGQLVKRHAWMIITNGSVDLKKKKKKKNATNM